ncbi:hypothetical protein MXB_1061 [Myxobolus squamalis]|nr:hypothetical protein MXB_1061 [Myxobolus squamalis]
MIKQKSYHPQGTSTIMSFLGILIIMTLELGKSTMKHPFSQTYTLGTYR